jgi:translation initiation factor 4G
MPYAPVQYAPPPNYATGFVPHGYPAPPQQQQLNTAVPSHALNGPDGTQPATTSSGVEQELQPLPTGVATAKTVPSQPQQQQSQDAAAATLPQNTNLTAAVPPKIQITQPVPTIITMGMPFIPGIPPSTQQQQQQQQQQPKPTEPLFKKATARVQIKLVNPDTNEEIKLAKPQPVAASPTANDKPEDKKPAATKETPATTEAKPAATAAPTKEIPKVAAAPVKEAPKSAAIEIKAAPPAAPSKAIPIEKPPVTAEQPAKPVEVKITEPPKQQQKPKEEPAAKPAPVTAAAEKPAVSAPKEQLKVTTAQEPLLPPPSKDEPKQRSRSPSPPKQTAPQKKTYTKEFLLSLREQCRERPLDMKMIEVVIGVTDESGGYGGSRRNSRRSGDRASDASFASVGGSGRYGSGRGSAALDGSAPSTRGGPRGSAGVSRQSSGPGKYPPAPSGGRGGSSRRGRGGRGGAPTEREREPPAPAIVLPKSENRWVPKSIAAAAVGAAAALAEESEDEKLYRKASGLLNKLTPEKFDKIVGQLLELPITSQKLNEGMMRVIFEKALDEPKFSSLYAGVCVRFVTNPPKFGMFTTILCKISFFIEIIVHIRHQRSKC